MKEYESYMIYNSIFPISVKAMETSLEKSKPFIRQWNLCVFDGCNPHNLKEYRDKWPLKVKKYYKRRAELLAPYTECCFYSHFFLWHKAIEKKKVTIILEHDFHCSRPIDENILNGDYDFLHLALSPDVMKKHYMKSRVRDYHQNGEGIHSLPLYCHSHHKVPMFSGAHCYAITPTGAEKAVNTAIKEGWEASDAFINETLGKCKYVSPVYAHRAIDNPNTTEARGNLKNNSKILKRNMYNKIASHLTMLLYNLVNVDNKYLTRKEKLMKYLHLLVWKYPFLFAFFIYRNYLKITSRKD